jgi:hypothetical protein
MKVGDIIELSSKHGIEFSAEIVRVCCPSCGEEFMGSKRGAGGFVAGHSAFHEFENTMDLVVNSLGGA